MGAIAPQIDQFYSSIPYLISSVSSFQLEDMLKPGLPVLTWQTTMVLPNLLLENTSSSKAALMKTFKSSPSGCQNLVSV